MSEQTYATDYSQGAPWEPIWAMLQEVARRQEESARRQEATDRQLKENSRQMGDLSNKLGTVVEHLVAPNLLEKFKALGVFVTSSGTRVIHDDRGNTKAEIDILLESKDCAVAVEVKTQPRLKDIQEHVKRMEILRDDDDARHIRRKLYGAIAGAIMEENVRTLILDTGFYAIEQSGDTMRVSVPETSGPKAW